MTFFQVSSPGQEALCLLQQLFPESSAYNVPLAWWVAPPVDREALRHAFQVLMDRHEPLRTVYPLSGKGFEQRIEEGVEVDFLATEAADREPATLLNELHNEAARPFDLTAGPVLRVRLWESSSEPSLLLVVAHHVALDGGSIRLLIEELGALYTAARRGRSAQLAALPLAFRDYVVAAAKRFEGEAGRRLRRYWLRQLGGAPTVLELPLDRPRPTVPSGRGGAVPGRLQSPLADRVREFARQHRATPFTVLVAAFQVLLHRYTGQDDLLMGTPTAGRRGSGAEALIGYFVNPVVLRGDHSGNPPFDTFMGRMREVVLDAFDHQDYPFARLAGELEPERDFGRHPVFQVVFTLLPPPPSQMADLYAGRMGFSGGRLELGELVLEPIPLDEGAARFDLTLLVVNHGDELALRLQYDAELLDASTARRLLHHYQTLLAAAVERPETPLSALPLLGAEERHQLVVEWNPDHVVLPARESPQKRFARLVRERPAATALVIGQEHLSYGKLAHRVSQTAACLRSAGVGPEARIGICMERSSSLVAAIVGVLAAGGAYVPLDPAYPTERLRFLVEDSGVELVLTDRLGRERLPAAAARQLRVDELTPEDGGPFEPTAFEVEAVADGQLAYVIYTSGSTGKPKGVGITHGNVARLLAATHPWFGFGPDDVWTLFHSYAFDFSVWEIWGALAFGGRLVVVPEEIRTSPADFRRLLLDEGVTVLNQTPSAFCQLIRADEEAGPPVPTALSWIIFGGEALELESLRPWLQRHGDRRPRLVNMYGITETTVHVTRRPLVAGDIETAAGSVIGEPIPDLQAHILDGHLRPVPIGVPGELCIGGAGLARGYLGRPGLTAARFVPDPTGLQPGARLYRSGDLARRLVDGDIEYLDRIDLQVKVRGHRIELGEVEAALAEHPDLREAAVVARGSGDETRLVAYGVPRSGVSPSVESMRELLSRRLPEYMVPARFVILDAFPLTDHGKLDRKALPEPAVDRTALEQPYIAPRTGTEAALAAAWAEVLGVERVGREDVFFTLGGDSIRAVRVVAEARRRGIEVSLQDLFRNSTLATLAARAAVEPARPEDEIYPGRPAAFSLLCEEDRHRLPPDVEDAYPLTALQAGMIAEGEKPAAAPLYHNVNGLYLRARLDPAALVRAVQTLMERHPVLRSSFHTTGFSEPLQLVHRRVEVSCPVVDLSTRDPVQREQQLEGWLTREKARRYDLRRAPLMRFVAHRLEEGVFHLGFSEHHVLADGWSMAVVRSELLQLYAIGLGDSVAPLVPSPRASFTTFVAAERRAVKATSARDFWQRKLAAAPLARLPRRPRHRELARGVVHQPVTVSERTLAGLQRLARAEGTSLKSVLLAAHLQVQSLLTGVSDLVTGVVTHGRPEVEDSERVVGLFVNSLPLRLTVPPRSGRELVVAAAAGEREILAHRAFPLAEIQSAAGGRRLFEVLFNFVHFHVSGVLGRLTAVELLERRIHAETELPLVVTFHLLPTGDRMEARLEGDLGELGTADLVRFAKIYERALGRLAEDANTSRIDTLVPAAERHRLLVEWSTGREAPTPLALPALFARQAERRPDAPALVAGDHQMTYAELDAATNRLARCLRRRGVGRGDRVGLLLERSQEAVVALLAVLKAGAAYVPLDPAYPEERLRGMLENAGVALLITGETAPPLGVDGLPRLCLASEAATIGAESDAPLPIAAAVDDLAYVMFTSGSTGRPKGVAVPHRAVARLLTEDDFAVFGAEQTWLQLAPLSFDASTLEIWGALGGGGRLVVMPAGRASLASVGEVIRRDGVTSMWLTAGLFHQMVDEELGALKGLHQLLAGGDVLSPEHVRRFLAAAPGARLVNGYGPTENTTFTCCHPMRGAAGAATVTTTVPIGRPISGTRVYVVDPLLTPLPAGVAGELVTGGDGLARGYLGQPARTAESFVPDPFAVSPGQRLYRTGDLVRWEPYGRLEFLGRRDGQVKVRGFRVETAEVAAVLGRHPAVREAVVVARGESADNRELAAYFVARASSPEAGELRRFLAASLPAFMVPSHFCELAELPLDPNGKVDRRALPAPEAAPRRGRSPRGLVEELVFGVWSRLLGNVVVGVDDDLFALGAHSLTLVRAASRLREVLAREVPLELLFEHPTPALQAAAIEALEEAPPLPPLLPRSPAGQAPLSPAQQRLWFFHRYEPAAPTYNVPLIYSLGGPLAAAALASALASVVARHEVLRTIYLSRDGCPVQRVSAADPIVPLPRVDLSTLPASRRRKVAWALAEDAVRRPFDLAAAPPLRVRLLTLAPREHLLVLAIHHIAFDGGSVPVLHRELAAFYAAALAGRPGEGVAPLPVQYADYSLWQHEVLESEAVRHSLEHWRRCLAGGSGLELPADRPRPAVRSSRGGRAARGLSPQSTAAVGALARDHNATRFMVFAAAFAAFLARTSGSADVIFGTPSGHRTPEAVETLVGCFLNPLVLRLDASGDPDFRELVRRVRRRALADVPHAAFPFERLVEELVPQRDLARSPLFQVLFAVEDSAAAELELEGLEVERQPVDLGAAKFDFALEVADHLRRPALAATYSSELFDATTVARFLGTFETLLADALAHPRRRLSQLAVLTPGEHQQVLHEWNDTARTWPSGPVHRWFEARVDRQPEAVAVEAEDGLLSYAELDRRANRLAHRLRRLGAGPEVAVAVAVRRTGDLMIAILGVLKAGACYVPLDPEYPRDRRTYVLRDSAAPLLVTRCDLDADLPESAVRPVPLDDPTLAAESALRPTVEIDPRHLAYSIYTSGSTGRPKGVQVPHGALANYVADMGRRVGFGAGQRLLAVTPLSFDISAFELLAPPAVGGTVVLVSPATAADGVALAARLDDSRIDLMQATPATWRLLIASGWGGTAGLVALCGGEALLPDLAQQIAERSDRLWNLYGPTETTVFSTAANLGGHAGQPVSLGRPIANTRVYVVTRDLEPCPAAVAGEVLIGGSGVARSYLGKPGMTAERFIPDPFSGLAGERLYRTGDLGRWKSDGDLDYLGRLDHQVKLHGFRIELGEIEAALQAHPAVGSAVVGLRGEDGVGRRLVAWYTAAEELPVDDLKADLRRRLPAYMVPAAFVHLSVLPKTPNNKVDRKALPEPEAERPHLTVRYLAPRSELERAVAALWRQVLGIDRVGLDDNFFDLGGNSLLAVELLDRMPVEASRRPTLVDLFRFPTVGSLAGWIGGEAAGGERLAAAAGRAVRRRQARRQRRGLR